MTREPAAEGVHPATPVRRWLVLGALAVAIAVVVVAFLPTGPEPNHAFAATRVRLDRAALAPRGDGWLPLELLAALDHYDPDDAARVLVAVDQHWRSGYAAPLLEVGRFSGPVRGVIASLLRRKADGKVSLDHSEQWRWLWGLPYEPHPDYAAFKANLYREIDPRFANYFVGDRPATIRLDEVRWGGVRRDGIPPLKNPRMIAARAATYLAGTDIVFGVAVGDDFRAYPKRILAWHEMFKDTVGGVSVNGVYCTLCGMMILYETEVDGAHHELGTSGFLYRSNKLMYDHATESMWSTTRGEPVIGPLVGKGIKLRTRPVVTTTWGEWRRRHPETTVLSLETGHRRDYGEGVAYRQYFATDRLMFTVPDVPRLPGTESLANKSEVLALRFGDPGAAPLAIHADYLAENPVYESEHGGQPYVVLTDASGANRVYATDQRAFAGGDFDGEIVVDGEGGRWTVEEHRLVRADGAELPRLPAHRAFWFGWRAAHPDTELVGG